MKATVMGFGIALLLLGGFTAAPAADLRDQVKVEVEYVGLHPGMDPGMYICARGHLHIKATVQNLAGVPLGQIKVSRESIGPRRQASRDRDGLDQAAGSPADREGGGGTSSSSRSPGR